MARCEVRTLPVRLNDATAMDTTHFKELNPIPVSTNTPEISDFEGVVEITPNLILGARPMRPVDVSSSDSARVKVKC